MSDPRDTFGAAFARDAGDPIRNLVAAASDAWTAGLWALQLMAEQAGAAVTGATPAAGSGSDPLSSLTALTMGLSAAMSDFVARGAVGRTGLRSTGPSSAALADFADGMDVSSPMARALMVGMTSTLRYWRGLAGVYARHQAILTRASALRTMAPSLSEAENRLLLDELRAFLREIGEVAMQEARRLERELEQIGETLAHGNEQPEPSAAYQRRWKAKD